MDEGRGVSFSSPRVVNSLARILDLEHTPIRRECGGRQIILQNVNQFSDGACSPGFSLKITHKQRFRRVVMVDGLPLYQ